MRTAATFAAILLSAALVGCAGPGAPAAASGAKPAAASQPAKPPGPFAPNGDADAAAGAVASTMTDTMKFGPNVIKAKAGAPVKVDLKNAGATVHNFYAPALGVGTPVKVNAGASGSATFTAPATPGTYPFWCNEPGHGEAGMTGQVVVE